MSEFPAMNSEPLFVRSTMDPVGAVLRCIACWMVLLDFAAAGPAPLSASDYATRRIEGWTVRVEKSLDTHPRKAESLKLLKSKLKAVTDAVPPSALPKLRKVPIWLSRNSARGAAYHPSAEWLLANGRVVEMERSIEIQNIDDFIDWSAAQPMMILHELAHAWHHQVAVDAYENADIKTAYEAAVLSGKYEEVRYYDGRLQRHYALTDRMEYFAECSEAYFGKNDFQPFKRKALKSFDPEGYRMVRKLWGATPP